MPQELRSLSQFNALKANTPLIIVDFYATWCGPCKSISPVFHALAKQYEHASSTASGSTVNPFISIVFAQCDVDKVKDITAACSISAMPTFQFFREGKLIDSVRGADVQQLKTKVGYYATAVQNASSETGAANSASNKDVNRKPASLRSMIDVDKSRLLNATLLSNVRNIITPPPEGYAIASTATAKVLIHILFIKPISATQIQLLVPAKSFPAASPEHRRECKSASW